MVSAIFIPTAVTTLHSVAHMIKDC